MELELFIARFHPLLVHLPIGFLLLAVVLEIIEKFSQKDTFRAPTLWALGLGVLASILAVATGLLLEGEGQHGGSALQQHKAFGIAVLVLSGLAFVLKGIKAGYHRQWSVIGSLVIGVLLSITGHLGGVLTHGESYLGDYAPSAIAPLLGAGDEVIVDLEDIAPDSILVYDHILQPVLEAKCMRCHNTEEARGGLDLTAFVNLFMESETSTAVVAGSPHTSELFRRVTLDAANRKFMPPSGDALSYTELTILKWWIAQGADSLQRFDYEAMDEELVALVMRDYEKDLHPLPYYERVSVAQSSEELLDRLRANGFSVEYLGENNFLLDLAFRGENLEAGQYNLLTEVEDKVVFLDLSNTQLPSPLFERIPAMKHLVRLDLHGSNITDEDLDALTGLEHLEVINLYKTGITDVGLEAIAKLESLKRLYIWQTAASNDYVGELRTSRPDLDLIGGFAGQ